MTYKLSASRTQEGQSSVTGIFSYEENIMFDTYDPKKEEEYKASAKNIIGLRLARQNKVQDTIIKFLKETHQARGIRKVDICLSDDGFMFTNSFSKQERKYYGNSNGTDYKIEVSGKLNPGEHLEDILDCDTLDAQLNQVFEEAGETK